eukprot:354085-Chlamydomonas_euryale.AAC.2
MSLRCHGLAKSLGESHNQKNGVTPLEWLHAFGSSINAGVNRCGGSGAWRGVSWCVCGKECGCVRQGASHT